MNNKKKAVVNVKNFGRYFFVKKKLQDFVVRVLKEVLNINVKYLQYRKETFGLTFTVSLM